MNQIGFLEAITCVFLGDLFFKSRTNYQKQRQENYLERARKKDCVYASASAIPHANAQQKPFLFSRTHIMLISCCRLPTQLGLFRAGFTKVGFCMQGGATWLVYL